MGFLMCSGNLTFTPLQIDMFWLALSGVKVVEMYGCMTQIYKW